MKDVSDSLAVVNDGMHSRSIPAEEVRARGDREGPVASNALFRKHALCM